MMVRKLTTILHEAALLMKAFIEVPPINR